MLCCSFSVNINSLIVQKQTELPILVKVVANIAVGQASTSFSLFQKKQGQSNPLSVLSVEHIDMSDCSLSFLFLKTRFILGLTQFPLWTVFNAIELLEQNHMFLAAERSDLMLYAVINDRKRHSKCLG